MYRVSIRVERVPAELGIAAAHDIAEAFQLHRPWQTKVRCTCERAGLSFSAENDFDENGLATTDEFAQEFSGIVPILEHDDGNMTTGVELV